MLKYEWNGLRPGDRVLVHEAGPAEYALTPGVVAHVEPHRGGNRVSVRVDTNRGQDILWPSSLVVHGDPPDPSQPCWRCQEVAERAETQ